MAERLVALRMGGFPRRSHGSPSLHVCLLSRSASLLEKQTRLCWLSKRQSNTQELAGGELLRLRPGGLCSKRDLHIWMR